ncbi:linamarin synthase 2-like [Gossypium hirsutum]|uniref:Linamarin synthase 2-like n=1 Tax=Gossypium hirsutum TaxID=3635 RepID=A0ABM2ZSF8_GOSHI|nr:linamarin synthase 2-like [Gossypium hirsutum]
MGLIKSHAVCLPFPAQGHVNPMMQLAKLLHSRGFHITFVNTEFNHRRLIRSRGEEAVKDEGFVSDGTLEMAIDWIPGMPNMRLKDLPSFIRTTDPEDTMFNYLMEVSQECLESSSIIFNTFDEFEKEVLQVIASKSPNIYAIGPLTSLSRNLLEIQHNSLNSSLWKEDTSCIEWLNTMKPKSVVYVNYGSVTVMSNHHLEEFAWGLANSKYPFLWVIRPGVVMGESAILPREFMEAIKGRGFITSWCPQQQVLSHPAIGVFLTHCGWNSLLEVVSEGVPLICWPFFGDQQTNCRYSCTTWGNGMEINPDVKRKDVEALVKEIMEGDNGQRIRQKALEWKKKS